ncbi:unnamed protein product, partial [Notodromas monacha]
MANRSNTGSDSNKSVGDGNSVDDEEATSLWSSASPLPLDSPKKIAQKMLRWLSLICSARSMEKPKGSVGRYLLFLVAFLSSIGIHGVNTIILRYVRHVYTDERRLLLVHLAFLFVKGCGGLTGGALADGRWGRLKTGLLFAILALIFGVSAFVGQFSFMSWKNKGLLMLAIAPFTFFSIKAGWASLFTLIGDQFPKDWNCLRTSQNWLYLHLAVNAGSTLVGIMTPGAGLKRKATGRHSRHYEHWMDSAEFDGYPVEVIEESKVIFRLSGFLIAAAGFVTVHFQMADEEVHTPSNDEMDFNIVNTLDTPSDVVLITRRPDETMVREYLPVIPPKAVKTVVALNTTNAHVFHVYSGDKEGKLKGFNADEEVHTPSNDEMDFNIVNTLDTPSDVVLITRRPDETMVREYLPVIPPKAVKTVVALNTTNAHVFHVYSGDKEGKLKGFN